MTNVREKGKKFERLLASYLREYGYDTHRSAQFCGKTGQAADVIGLPGIHIEAKHQEQMRLYDWMDQAKRDAAATGDGLPTVMHKKNHADILVTMRLEDWMQIYREWEAGNTIEDEWIIQPYDDAAGVYVHRCGACLKTAMLGGSRPRMRFCPNCGSRMRIDQEIIKMVDVPLRRENLNDVSPACRRME